MATPRLNRIITEFMTRIGDSASYDTGVLQDGSILTAAQAVSYVNRAMLQYIDDISKAVRNDTKLIIQLFPELVVTPTAITTNSSGQYSISSTSIRDFWMLIDATYSNSGTLTYIQRQPEHLYNTYLTGRLSNYSSTAASPNCFQLGSTLVFLPAATFNAVSVNVSYLKLPLNPTTGDFLTQNGTYDCPLYDLHNSNIAEIAEKLYLIESQNS